MFGLAPQWSGAEIGQEGSGNKQVVRARGTIIRVDPVFSETLNLTTFKFSYCLVLYTPFLLYFFIVDVGSTFPAHNSNTNTSFSISHTTLRYVHTSFILHLSHILSFHNLLPMLSAPQATQGMQCKTMLYGRLYPQQRMQVPEPRPHVPGNDSSGTYLLRYRQTWM